MMRELCAACAILAVASLVGCNKEEAPVDPYMEASLREAVYGEVVSPEFKYKIINPEIVEGLGEFLVVRQTNMTEFIAGNGIAGKVDSLSAIPDSAGAKPELTFNVIKQFSPMVHFLCTSVVTATDSVAIPTDKPIAFPRTSDAASFVPPSEYLVSEMVNFKWNDTERLRKVIGNKYTLEAHLVQVPEDSVTSWMLVGDSSQTVWGEVPKLRITAPRPSLEVVLRVLERTGQKFEGGVTYKDIEPWDFRRKNHVCGTVDIGYIRFMDKVFSR
jgi:hypothetical protein